MVHESITPTHPHLQHIQNPVLVVGGTGFLGSHVVEYLLSVISTDVHVLDITPPAASNPRIKFHSGSLLDYGFVHQILLESKIKTVVHTASPPHGKPRSFMYAVNVVGTKNLIQASLSSHVTSFVYTSSSSVVFDGSADLFRVAENDVYCQVALDAYTETKAIAEDLVLKANHLPTEFGNSLKTLAIRPSTIYGPRDLQHLSKLLDQILKKKSQFAVGTGRNLNDFTYVENLAYAHLLACSKLNELGSNVAGEPFFITDDDPKPIWELNKCLHRHIFGPNHPLAIGASSILIPKSIMMIVAYILGFVAWAVSLIGVHFDPLILPSRVLIVTKTRTFNIEKAKARLNYAPLFTMDQAMTVCVNWVRSLDRYRSFFINKNPATVRAVQKLHGESMDRPLEHTWVPDTSAIAESSE